jgi:hypothetical protein
MSDSVAPVAPQPDATGTPVNPLQRIVGVFLSPSQTFESIAKRPDVVVPLLILLAITVASAIFSARSLDFDALARDTIESAPNTAQVSPQQQDRAVRFTSAIMKTINYASPAVVLLALVVSAGVLLLAFRLMAGEGDFKQAFAVTTYTWYPRMLKGIIGVLVLMNRKVMSIYDLQNPVKSNLAFLFNPKTQPLQFALGSSLDLFSIWALVLLIIGFAALSKLSRARSAIIVVALWIVLTLLTLIGPAIQASRLKG